MSNYLFRLSILILTLISVSCSKLKSADPGVQTDSPNAIIQIEIPDSAQNEDPINQTPPAEQPPVRVPPKIVEFWSEPSTAVTIGQGQSFHLYAVFKPSIELFPSYIDLSQVQISISNEEIIGLSPTGLIYSKRNGSSLIKMKYQNYETNLTVTVDGAWGRRSIQVPGQGERFFNVYIPSGLAINAPALFALHGGGGNPDQMAESSLLNTQAAIGKFLVVYPEGSGVVKTFNAGVCCSPADKLKINDVKYIDQLIEQMKLDYVISADRIFVTGFSNGAIMSHRLACELSSKIAGVAAVSGGSGQYDANMNSFFDCNPIKSIRILQIHASNDRNYPLNGGTGLGPSGTYFYSVSATVNDWISRNHLNANLVTTEKIGANTTCLIYSNALDAFGKNSEVRYCLTNPVDLYDANSDIVYGGGHSWPGGVKSQNAESDIPSLDYSASQLIAEMVKK